MPSCRKMRTPSWQQGGGSIATALGVQALLPLPTAFSSDKQFYNALNQSFEYFVNLNQHSPEYISLFVDEQLRKGMKGTSEEEVEAVLDKVVMLFRYLQEKDVFEKYYKQHLAKRLLGGRSISDDAERSMIGKLKIMELRERAQTELGDNFDIRAFHDVILKTGPVPLAIMEENVDAWIAEER